jgi:hypothetical protein
MRRLLAAALLALAVVLVASPAFAATWSAPGDAPLTGTLAKGRGAWAELPWSILHNYNSGLANIRSAERMSSGETLIACAPAQATGAGKVVILDPAGGTSWLYERAGISPWSATASPDGATIVVVSRFEQAVFAIDRASGQEIWRYGFGGWSGAEGEVPPIGLLSDPFYAVRLANGNTLICDNRGNRLIEVATGDYDPAAPDGGFTDASIVWSHQFPTGMRPKFAQRLGNGNTLVTTDQGIVEVTTGGATVPLFPGMFSAPVSAVRLDDGTTLIAEEQSFTSSRGRALRVDAAGNIVWEFSVNSLLGLADSGPATPRRTLPGTNGSVIVADQSNARVLELGYALSGSGQSAATDCGLGGVRKLFTSVSLTLEVPEGTSASASYSIDGGAWQPLTASALPAGTYGKLIAYRVEFASTRHDRTPRLLGASIGYEAAPESSGSGNGSGTGSGTGSGRGTGTATGSGTGSGSGSGTGPGIGGGGLPAVPLSAAVDDASAVHRGFTMARVGVGDGPSGWGGGGIGDGSGGGSSPAPALGGLLMLGALYGTGVLSVPLQRLFAFLFGRPTLTL